VKTSGLTRALFGFEATVALKNLKRSRKKYRATIVSLVISIVLFLTVSMYASMTQTIYGVTEDGFNFDIAVSYSNVSDAQRDSVNESITSLDLVTGHTQAMRSGGDIAINESMLSESSKMVYGDVGDSSPFGADLIALDKESFRAYADAVGVSEEAFADTASPKAILINYGQSYHTITDEKVTKISGDILNVQKGDTLSFYTNPENKDDAAALTIGAVTDERPMGTLIQSMTNVTLVVSEDVFNAVVSTIESLTPDGVNHTLFVTTSDDQKLEKQLSQVLRTLPDSSSYVFNVQSQNRSQQSLNTFLGVFVYGFIILISLICIANIFNTVSTNIALRRREFAMLRSVGMTPGGFNRMVRFESIFYGLKALLFGLPISVLISYLLYQTQQSILISGFTLPWESYGFAVLMLLVIVFSTMLYSTHKIKKENIIDALKDENL
jgi:putative ABC transport system permease protein